MWRVLGGNLIFRVCIYNWGGGSGEKLYDIQTGENRYWTPSRRMYMAFEFLIRRFCPYEVSGRLLAFLISTL